MSIGPVLSVHWAGAQCPNGHLGPVLSFHWAWGFDLSEVTMHACPVSVDRGETTAEDRGPPKTVDRGETTKDLCQGLCKGCLARAHVQQAPLILSPLPFAPPPSLPIFSLVRSCAFSFSQATLSTPSTASPRCHPSWYQCLSRGREASASVTSWEGVGVIHIGIRHSFQEAIGSLPGGSAGVGHNTVSVLAGHHQRQALT